MVWPVGMGTDFRGCFDFNTKEFLTAEGAPSGGYDLAVPTTGLDDPKLEDMVPAAILENARETAELAQGGYSDFDEESYHAGHLTPVVFGSALRDYSVKSLVDFVADHAPPPRPSPADTRIVSPDEDAVTGFVFKVQANMDPKHRDRVAFMRVSSGLFQRGMKLKQVRTGKDIVVHSPILFLAQDREIADDAGPGDVIGIPNHGTVRVGDTFTEGEDLRFTGLPAFAPEHLSRIRLTDTSKNKQLRRALDDLAEEGLLQVFRPSLGAHYIVGVVGVLQLEVLVARAAQEYKIEIGFESAGFDVARWIKSSDNDQLEAFIAKNPSSVVRDNEDRPVFLARNSWDLDYTEKNNEGIEFLKTRELD
ncbi:UNVERIFIED_CONTAM: hypothetical protein GTU68_020524 [Idotea baltica]|nr:hypothetical protein [Idotea baltica]